eukprot:TRINITY_DN4049_c0_g1_i1.p1 TRINITY_DN4049_c0_g1~~TRINITY_DN4049_c0_g1_i1.p1  ORF type:complete len:861 (+),score=164.43 TRINITY_DN4049_c0_g1_i1:44-2626(+)
MSNNPFDTAPPAEASHNPFAADSISPSTAPSASTSSTPSLPSSPTPSLSGVPESGSGDGGGGGGDGSRPISSNPFDVPVPAPQVVSGSPTNSSPRSSSSTKLPSSRVARAGAAKLSPLARSKSKLLSVGSFSEDSRTSIFGDVDNDLDTDFDITELEDDFSITDMEPRRMAHLVVVPEQPEEPSSVQFDFSDISSYLENPRLREALEKGLSLEKLNTDISDELFDIEKNSILEYKEQREAFQQLTDDLDECDNTLGEIGEIFGGYQSSLETIFSQVEEMYISSKKDMKRLDNHVVVQKKLSELLNDIYFPENLSRAITNGKMNQGYIQYISAFTDKINFLKDLGETRISAVAEQREIVQKLIVTACQRIHAWLWKKVSSVTSVTALQKRQSPLLKYKSLFVFLATHDPEKARTIPAQYIAVTSTLYCEHFRPYTEQIPLFQSSSTSSSDLLGESDKSLRSFFTSKIDQTRGNIYSLETRKDSLSQLDYGVEIPDETSTTKYPFEYLFRGVNFLFLTFTIKEYRFCKELFSSNLTDRILGRTASLLNAAFHSYLENSYDLLGLVMLKCILSKQRQILVTETSKSVVRDYYRTLYTELKTRIETVFALHLQSVQPSGKSFTFFEEELDLRAPHYVTRRYAELLASMLVLSEKFPKALKTLSLESQLKSLQTAMEEHLQALSQKFTNKQHRLIFLINNYDLIVSLSVLKQVSSPSTEHFHQLLEKESNVYAEGQFNGYFQKLRKYLQSNTTEETETQTRRILTPAKSGNDGAEEVDEILRLFTQNDYWKESALSVASDIKSQFSNFTNGMGIYSNFLEKVFVSYDLLLDIINKHFKLLKDSQHYLPRTELKYAIRSLNSDFIQ